MKQKLPQTLVQIHYHNRVGGVSTVMQRYAAAFKALHQGKTHENIILCNVHKESIEFAGSRVCSFPCFDYAEFSTLHQFNKAVEKCMDALQSVISPIAGPICVIGHNLTLGKNCALSSAVTRYARQAARKTRLITFFSVIHDFAEEGRIAQLKQIDHLEKIGASILRDLYPCTSAICFVTLNERNLLLLKKVGLPAVLLPNPLDTREASKKSSSGSRRIFMNALSEFCKHQGTKFDSTLPFIFYPARFIARKNCIEAILLATMHKANLIIGSSGSAPEDARVYAVIKEIVLTRKLPVVFDIDQIKPFLPETADFQASVFSLCYRFCDKVISTSIAEGFGYALFEPWLFGKALLGRQPLGFTAPNNLDFSNMYDQCTIPSDWIDRKAICRHYLRAYKKMNGTTHNLSIAFQKKISSYFMDSEKIDFAALDYDQQIKVFKRLLDSPDEMALLAWHRQGEKASWAISETLNGVKVRKNRAIVQEEFSFKKFERRFKLMFTRGRKLEIKRVDIKGIRQYFCTIEHFRILLSATN